MTTRSRLRGAVVAAVVAPLAVTTLGTAPAHAALPTTHGDLATSWIEGQLTNGLLHNQQYDFDDVGLSIDAALLANADGHAGTVTSIANSVAGQVDSYVKYVDGTTTYTYGGQTAKAAVLAQIAGQNPEAYGGHKLITELKALLDSSGPNAGEVQNRTQATTTTNKPVNTISQALAVRALAKSGSTTEANSARDFLLLQQCASGGFRSAPNSNEEDQNQSCGTGAAEQDTTALTVLQLQGLKATDTKVQTALSKAAAWLVTQQQADGSVANDQGANANTTGLAAAAFVAQANDSAAGRAASWVRALQVAPCTTGALASQVGAIAYDSTALATARSAGITAESSDQFRRSTAQAGLGLIAVPTAAPTCTSAAPVSGPLDLIKGKKKVHRKKVQTITVTGFAPGEPALGKFRKRTYAGNADANGAFVVRFKVGKKVGKVAFRAFSSSHAAKVKFKVIK